MARQGSMWHFYLAVEFCMLWELCQECVWGLLLKTCLECDFWTQLFSFPQETESDVWANSLQLGFYFHFYLFIYLFFFTVYRPFDFQKIIFREKVEWPRRHSANEMNDFPPQQLSDYALPKRLLSISFKLPGYSGPIYNCAARRLYARLVWNGFT